MPALERLRSLQTEEASGEFIAAAGDLEVHVFLQRGRVAWATSSRARQTFREYLSHECGVSQERITEALERCRELRANIGEALVALSIATAEQVKAALRAQVATALAQLQQSRVPHVLFLRRERAFASYDPQLTFALGEVLSPRPEAPGPSAPQVDLVPAAHRALPQLRWVEHVVDGALARRAPNGPSSGSPAWHAATIATGVQQVLIRQAGSLTLGVRLEGGRSSLWGRLDDGLAPGAAQEAFMALGEASPPPGEPRRRDGPPTSVGPCPASAAGRLQRLLLEDSDLSAVALTTPEAPPFVVGHAALGLEALQTQLARRKALLEVLGFEAEDDPVRSPVLALAEPSGWWFALPVQAPARAHLWVLGQPALSTGLGFAVARSLARRLSGALPV
jgi:hypothetical protein